MQYHPNFFDGGDAHRQDCHDRLKILKSYIQEGSLLDVGCSEGFNTFGLEEECDGAMVAFDSIPELIEECNLTRQKYGGKMEFRVQGLADFLKEDTRTWDSILFLSVHHHLIEQSGMEEAGRLLRDLSTRGTQMFFDMGQKDEEGCEEHGWWQMLPKRGGVEEKEWLWLYLSSNTNYRRIDVIWSFPIHGTQRLLWRMS